METSSSGSDDSFFVVRTLGENGKFTGLKDFVDRLSGKEVNKRTVESFIKAGAFDGFGLKRRQLMMIYIQVVDSVAQDKKHNMAGQMSLFDLVSDEQKSDFDIPMPKVGEYEKETKYHHYIFEVMGISE